MLSITPLTIAHPVKITHISASPKPKAPSLSTAAHKSVNDSWNAQSGYDAATKRFTHDVPGSIPYPFQVINVGTAAEEQKATVKTLSPAEAAKALKHVQTISIGDLHSSSLKLFETLVVGNLIHMPEKSKKAMHKLLAKMQNKGDFANKLLDDKGSLSPLLKKVLDDHLKKLIDYDKKLSHLIPDIQWKNKDRKLIIIGDEVADRGPFDPTILKMLKHLDTIAPGKQEYMASNHGHSTLGFISDGTIRTPLSTNIHSMEKTILAGIANQLRASC